MYHGTTSFRGLHTSDVLQLSDDQCSLFGKDEVHELLPEYWLIKVNRFDDIAKDSLDEWIYFLKNEEIRDDFSAKGIKKAKQELDIMKLSEEECQAYMDFQDDLHYQASMTECTYAAGMIKGNDKRERGRKGKKKGEKRKNRLLYSVC